MNTPALAKQEAAVERLASLETPRAAYSLAEFARLFGRTPTWAHRLHYAGKVKVITGLGRKLIPHSEVERVIGEAGLIAGKSVTVEVVR